MDLWPTGRESFVSAAASRAVINTELERHSRALLALTMRAMDDATSELSPSALRALLALDERGACKLAALADDLRLSQSAASRLVDRLVSNGLVHRGVAPESRREVRIAPTSRGRRVTRRVLERRQQAIDEVIARMHPAEVKRLLAGLAAFAAAASDHND
jgi:DNA-binding MarR family transcriptional regulator